MLTGDKRETAQEIGYSCGLFDRGFPVFTITESDEPVFEQLKVQFEESQKIKVDYGVLIGGSHLTQIFEN
jgi:magnesium-transporting ATPase (P-type)